VTPRVPARAPHAPPTGARVRKQRVGRRASRRGRTEPPAQPIIRVIPAGRIRSPFGFWFIASRSTSAFLGYCGIRPLALGGSSEIEIGWHTKKTRWNQGVATEAAKAARDLAFRRFRLTRLVAIIHPDHFASRRVAEKIGMRSERTTIIDDDYPAVVYTIGRSR
jgi:RimJ/RimL family protein N-acetyltransferase